MKRWNRTYVMAGIGLLLLPAVALSLARGQSLSETTGDLETPPARAIQAGSQAFVLLPPDLIATPQVENLSYAPTGHLALVQRRSLRPTLDGLIASAGATRPSPPGLASLVLWDSRTRTSREVWRSVDPDAEINNPEWLPHTSTGLVFVTENVPGDRRDAPGSHHLRERLLRIVPNGADVLAETNGDADIYLSVSPTQPMAVVQITRPASTNSAASPSQRSISILDARGQTVASATLPPEMARAMVIWDDQGLPDLMLIQQDAAGHSTIRWFSVDSRTAAVRPLDHRPGHAVYNEPPTTTEPLRLLPVPGTLKQEGTTQNVSSLWLESTAKSEQSRVLVCADGTHGQILPGGDAVVYVSQGAAWAAPLLKLTSEQYTTFANGAEKARVIEDAKQIGTAVQSYAQDWDEHYPPEGDINPALSSYLLHRDALKGFVFTGKRGIPLAAIPDSSATMIGYIPGPGGRAVLYADSHVRWQTEP